VPVIVPARHPRWSRPDDQILYATQPEAQPAWRAAYDEIVTSGVKRNEGIERMIGALPSRDCCQARFRSTTG
jgi:hypothetical protein